jgi:hypothetical protein
MSLKDEFEKIIDAELRDLGNTDRNGAAFGQHQVDRFDEVRPLFTEFADAVDDTYVRVRMSESRVVIDVGERPSETDLFVIDGRWELEPSRSRRFLAEPGHGEFRRRSGFVLWKTLYLRPLMEPENLSWDRFDFDSGVEAFQYVVQDIARQVAHHRRQKQAPYGA